MTRVVEFRWIQRKVVEFIKDMPQLNLGIKQYINNQIQYQEANTVNEAYERRTKTKRVLYDAQMQGGMSMISLWCNNYIYEVAIILLDQVALQLLDKWDATTLPH